MDSPNCARRWSNGLKLRTHDRHFERFATIVTVDGHFPRIRSDDGAAMRLDFRGEFYLAGRE